MRRDLKPGIQRAAFVGLEVTEADVPNRRRVDDARYCFAHHREHASQSSVKQERFVIPDEEVIELEVDLGHKNRHSVYIGRYFSDVRHAANQDSSAVDWNRHSR
jgi:hypothetical protein